VVSSPTRAMRTRSPAAAGRRNEPVRLQGAVDRGDGITVGVAVGVSQQIRDPQTTRYPGMPSLAQNRSSGKTPRLEKGDGLAPRGVGSSLGATPINFF